jgi:hypothetical protein
MPRRESRQANTAGYPQEIARDQKKPIAEGAEAAEARREKPKKPMLPTRIERTSSLNGGMDGI